MGHWIDEIIRRLKDRQQQLSMSDYEVAAAQCQQEIERLELQRKQMEDQQHEQANISGGTQ